jgi:phosphotransferase system HPr (HPr) family protein
MSDLKISRKVVEIVKGDERVDAKSILAIFTLAALPGTELIVEAEGPDASDAVSTLCDLFARGFDELDEKSEDTQRT